MASKKTNNGEKSKKPINNQRGVASPFFGFLKKWWWAILLITLLVFGVSSFAYEKYLDRQNVADMKQLLADFEQLEKDVEAETGEELTIEASCESVGKFSESYACYLYLKNPNNSLLNYSEFIADDSSLLDSANSCRIISGKGAKYINFYSCSFKVRDSSINSSEEIFYKYDTSPDAPG